MTRRVKTHTRLGIRSVSPSDQSPRCPYEEILGSYPARNFGEFIREMSRTSFPKFRGVSPRSFSANFRGVSPRKFAEKTLGEIIHFYFSPRKKIFRARGVPRRNAKKKKKSFFLGLNCIFLEKFAD